MYVRAAFLHCKKILSFLYEILKAEIQHPVKKTGEFLSKKLPWTIFKMFFSFKLSLYLFFNLCGKFVKNSQDKETNSIHH